MLVLLPPTPGLDIVLAPKTLAESKGFFSSSSMGGETGARGNGFSRLLLMDLSLSLCVSAEYVWLESISKEVCVVVERSSSCASWMTVAICGFVVEVSMFAGRFLVGCDTEPRRLMPLLTPLKNSPFSSEEGLAASSPLAGSWFADAKEKAEENFDSNDALGRNVSLSAMVTFHTCPSMVGICSEARDKEGRRRRCTKQVKRSRCRRHRSSTPYHRQHIGTLLALSPCPWHEQCTLCRSCSTHKKYDDGGR